MSNDPNIVAQIQQLETLAANAWPAAEVEDLAGWQLRYTSGVTRRANSVWPNDAVGEMAVAEKVAVVEAFYRARNQPARYQMSPAAQPTDLDDYLAAQGYIAEARTAVQAALITTILAKTPPLRLHPEFVIEVAEEFDEGWFAAYAAFAEENAAGFATRAEIIQRIPSPTGFALLRIDEQPAAVGLGVVEAGWLGIFCMGTAPVFRRRGAARAILRTLTIWAQMQGAEAAYLQVMDSNAAARPLYDSIGFQTLYHYHYREKR